jgi:hypothetical protein
MNWGPENLDVLKKIALYPFWRNITPPSPKNASGILQRFLPPPGPVRSKVTTVALLLGATTLYSKADGTGSWCQSHKLSKKIKKTLDIQRDVLYSCKNVFTD